MDIKLEALMAVQAGLATLLGGLIGWEREQHGREAGIRTYAAVCLGACVFGLVSGHVSGLGDKTRIAAQVVSGIGFLGAGVILREQGRVTGLTTAGTLWATAAVGLAIAFGMYALGLLTALLIFGLLALHHCPGWSRFKAKLTHSSTEVEVVKSGEQLEASTTVSGRKRQKNNTETQYENNIQAKQIRK